MDARRKGTAQNPVKGSHEGVGDDEREAPPFQPAPKQNSPATPRRKTSTRSRPDWLSAATYLCCPTSDLLTQDTRTPLTGSLTVSDRGGRLRRAQEPQIRGLAELRERRRAERAVDLGF